VQLTRALQAGNQAKPLAGLRGAPAPPAATARARAGPRPRADPPRRRARAPAARRPRRCRAPPRRPPPQAGPPPPRRPRATPAGPARRPALSSAHAGQRAGWQARSRSAPGRRLSSCGRAPGRCHLVRRSKQPPQLSGEQPPSAACSLRGPGAQATPVHWTVLKPAARTCRAHADSRSPRRPLAPAASARPRPERTSAATRRSRHARGTRTPAALSAAAATACASAPASSNSTVPGGHASLRAARCPPVSPSAARLGPLGRAGSAALGASRSAEGAPEGPAVQARPQHDGLPALLARLWAHRLDRAQQLPVAPGRHERVPAVSGRCSGRGVILQQAGSPTCSPLSRRCAVLRLHRPCRCRTEAHGGPANHLAIDQAGGAQPELAPACLLVLSQLPRPSCHASPAAALQLTHLQAEHLQRV